MKRHSTNRRHHHRNVLEVRVMSPRIAWIGCLRFFGWLAKIACVLAVLAGIGWGVWRGVQHAFYQNPDFALQVIDLNPNPVIDEVGLVETLGIDLAASPSLFEIDVAKGTEKLRALPAVTEARVERHLPGKLVVRIVPRQPKAWIRCKENGLVASRQVGAMLVDPQGVAFPCPELQLESAATLPVIDLPATHDNKITAGAKIEQSELAHCFRLLDAARAADPEAVQWIDTIRQANEWSLELVTRQGTCATFGLGDHERQMESLRAALDHAGEKGYAIQTINLIPKYNIPITIREDSAPPRAIVVSPPDTPGGTNRHERDLGTLLNRN
jgi:cell division septal protein FtsQ